MDERKMKALVEWVNALLPSEYIESLTQLKDGRHFCKLVSFLDRDQNTEFSVAEDRYRMVFSVLETYYHGSFLDKINIAQVIEQGNELEIAKICLLLLCAGVLDGSTVMKAATTLEVDNQLEIYEMIEPIIKPQSEQINLLDETVSAVLRKRREEPRALYSEAQMSSTPNCQTSGQNSENSPALRQTPILKMSLLGIGGLQDLCEVYSSSPVMSTKIKIQQQDQRIKCLTRELNAERHTCDELEAKLKELEKKDQIINDLQQQLTVAKRQLSASQLSHESEMFSQNEDQIEPMRERIMELSKEARDQREEIRFLKESNKELMEENETLKDKLNRFSAHHVQCSEYKESFMVAEKSLAELKELLHDKENQLTSLMKANQILESDLKSMQELYKQQQQEWRQAMETSIQNESGECLFGVVEKQLNEQIALLQESLANEQKLKNELKEQISRLQESLANEQREKDRWNQESHHLKDSLEALNRKYVKAEREMRSEKKRWSEMSERLEQELEEHRNIEREKQEVINRLNEILEANQQKISSLEERLHQQQICHEQQLSDLSCKLKGLQELNTRLQSELEDYKRSNHDLEQMLSEERVKVQRWQSEYSNVKQELDVVRESSQAELSELDNELQHLRSELNNTKQWKRDLEEQLVQRENELAEWQSRCAKLEKAASAREEQYSTDISQLNCKLETLQSELENMTTCKCDLEEQLKRAEHKQAECKHRFNELEEKLVCTKRAYDTEMSELHQKLEALQSALETIEQEKSDVEHALSQEEHKRANWESKFTCLKEEMNSAKEAYHTNLCQLNEKISSLQSELQTMEQLKSDAENSLLREQQERTEWQSKYIHLEEVVSATEREHGTKIGQLNLNLESLQSELEQVKQDKHDLEKTSSEERTEWQLRCAKLDEEVNVIRQEYAKHQEETSLMKQEYEAELTKVSKKVDRLHLELENMKQAKSDLENLLSEDHHGQSEWQARFGQLQQELNDTKKQYENELCQLNENMESLQADLQQTRQAKCDLEKLLSEEQHEHMGWQSKYCDIQQELRTVRETYSAEVCQLNGRIEALQLEVESLEKAKCRVETLLAEECVKSTELVSKCSDLEMKMSISNDEHCLESRELGEKVKRLQSELEETKEAKHQVEKLFSRERLDWLSKSSGLESEIKLIKQKSESEITKLEKELEVARQRNSHLQLEVNRFQVKLEHLENALCTSKVDYESAVEKLKDQVTVAEEKHARLEKAITEYRTKNEMFSANQQEYFEKVLLMEEALKQSKEEALQLRRSYEEQVKSEKERAALEKEKNTNLLDELDTQRCELEKAMSRMLCLETELGEKVKDVNELERRIEDLQVKLERALETKKELELQLSEAERNVVRFEDELRAIRAEKEQQKLEFEDVKDECAELRSKLSRAEQSRSEMEDEVRDSRQEIEQLKIEIRKLSEETAKKHDELTATVCKSVPCLESTEAEFKVELEQLEKEKEELVRENLLLKDTISKLNSQLAASRDSVERLENLVLELRSRMKISNGEEYERRCEMYEKEQSLRDSLDELRDSKASQRHEIEEFTSRIRQLEDRMSSAGDELATLQEDYSAALQRTDALVSELCKEKQSHEKTRSHLQEELAVARQNRQEALTQLEEQKAVCNEMMARLEQESRERKALEYKLHQSEQQVSQLISHQQEIEAIQDKLEETCSTEKSEAKATEDMYKDQIERMENKYRQLKHKVEELNSKLKEQKEEFRHQLEKERTEWSQRYKQMKELKVQYEDDVLRFKELARSVHEHYQSKTEQLVQMEQELNSCKEHAHIMERKFREADVEVAALKLQLKEETRVHKKLAAEINSLKTQLDHANRQLRAKQKSTKASPTMDDGIPLETSFSVDPDKDKQNHVTSSASDDLQSPEHPRKLTKNKHAGSNFSLASSNSSVVSESEAIMPLHRYPTRWRTSIGRLSKENEKMAEFGLNQDQYLRAKENRNLGGTFGITEDEPEEFEFGRLSELQRRNTLCLPHMRSSYPVETQVYDPKTIREEEVKVTDAFSNLVEDQKRLQRKRRSASELLLEDQAESRTPNNSTSRSASKRKYSAGSDDDQHPGPPTPDVTPAKATPQRFRTRHSLSSVVSTKKMRRSRRHFGPLKEKVKPKESDEIREKISRLSLAYSIGFTPKKSRRQTSQKKKPLADRNK